MKTTEYCIVNSRDVENIYHMRLMALLQELVREKGYKGAARMLEIDPQTVTNSAKSGQLTRRVREALERALQEGVGSAAERQRRRNEKLEARLDKMESQQNELREKLRIGLKAVDRMENRLDKVGSQVNEMKEDRRTGLKGLKMSLDGVRKYYCRTASADRSAACGPGSCP